MRSIFIFALFYSLLVLSSCQTQTCENLQRVATNDPNFHLALNNDIDCTGFVWTQIGNSSEQGKFRGTIEGNGHTIYNISYSTSGGDFSGMFSYGENANFRNVRFLNFRATLRANYNGGVFGRCQGNQIFLWVPFRYLLFSTFNIKKVAPSETSPLTQPLQAS